MAKPLIRKKDIDTMRLWQRDPVEWFHAIFPEESLPERVGGGKGLTGQQVEAFRELGKLVGVRMLKRLSQPVPEELLPYLSKVGLSIMSGHGTGKDGFMALIVLWFLYCFPNPKIPVTAPTGHQLKDIVWAEMAKWIRLSRKHPETGRPVLESLLEWQSDKVYLKEKKGREWFAIARSVNVKGSDEEQAETLAGFHEDFMLFCVTEASGVPDPVYKPIEGAMTGAVNLAILIFNPTRGRGFAYGTHFGDSARWVTLRWNSEESELVSREHCRGMEEKYGRDSNTYRIRVLGLPPVSASDTLIPWDWIEDAAERDIKPLDYDPVMLGVDVGAGGDKSVIAQRKGGKIYPLQRYNTQDTMQLVGHVVLKIQGASADATFIDVIGIGKGVYDRGREVARNVFAVDVRKKAASERFFQKRDELWWKLREQFEHGTISIPKDKDLMDQLGAIKWEPMESTGKIKVWSKKKLKAQTDLEHSPDEADAVCLTYAMDDAVFRKDPELEEDDRDEERHYPTRNAFMAV